MTDSIHGIGVMLTLIGVAVVHAYAFLPPFMGAGSVSPASLDELIMFLGGTVCWGIGYLLRKLVDRMDRQAIQETTAT